MSLNQTMSDSQPSTSEGSSWHSFPSPKKKRTKTGPLSSSEKQVIVNIFKYVEETWPKDEYPYKKVIVSKTAEIAGVSTTTVNAVLKQYRADGRVSSPLPSSKKPCRIDSLDDMDLGAIRRKVHQFFFSNEPPTIDKILKAVNDDDSLPHFDRTTMYKIMKKIGFKYSKRNRKSMLLDRTDITEWRVRYLREIEEARKEGKKIYYLDETWVNEGHTKTKVWQDTTIKSSKEAHREGLSTGLKNPSGKGKRLIVGHIGSSTGFLEEGELIFLASKGEGDYHSEMDAHNFEKWFDRILTKVESNSVIVMDNASYHSRKLEKIPTTATRKADIQKWLHEKGIAYENNDFKPQLLKKVKQERHKYEAYVVDEKAKQKGIKVIRLPPYHCELNPIELIWAQVKGNIAAQNVTFKLKELKNLLPEVLSKITEENWRNCEIHTIKEKEIMKTLDRTTDEVTDTFIIHVGEDSSSSESSGESDIENI